MNTTSWRLLFLFAAATALVLPATAQGPNAAPGSTDEPVIIVFKQPPGRVQQQSVQAVRGRVRYTYRLIPAIAATLPPAAIEALRRRPDVARVEPDALLYPFATPNDPSYPVMWGLNNVGQTGGTPDADIDAPEAWDLSTGSTSVIVANIDTGAQVAPGASGTVVTHPDLADNLWVNPGEIPGDNIDNDGNGYIDDIHGWNFYNDAAWLFNNASEDEHGTHTAGTIAAVGNNGTGVAGVNWQARVMVLKFIGPLGGFTSDAIAAIEYAADNGAQVINASWGGGPFSAALKAAIEASGCVFVAAAGNGGPDQIGDNNDIFPSYPASYNSPNIISVAATDHNDNRGVFSNFGAASVDLGAPGVNILSTVPNSGYRAYSGTSMAAPHVSGVAALVLSLYPDMTPFEVKQQILATVDPVPALAGITVTGGRLNAAAAVGTEPTPPSPTAVALFETKTAGTMTGSYTNTHASDGSYEVLTEVQSAGRLLTRYSTLQHDWIFNVLGGASVTFHVEARRADNADGDNFRFSYSTDGTTFTPLLVVNSPVEQVYSAPLPANTSGVVYIRVNDTDSTRLKLSLDSIHIDHMYIQSSGTANSVPEVTISSPPNNSNWDLGVAIPFAGTALDDEDGNLGANLQWTSNLDGPIGSGTSFSTAALSQGVHTVTASVTDSDGATGTATVTITVGPPPAGPPLYVAIRTDDTTYVSGEFAWIAISVLADTGFIAGASVHAVMTTPNNTVYTVDGISGPYGGVHVIHFIYAPKDGVGTYIVEATASKDGYEDGYRQITFEVTR
jgi:subtilisin family serine protease